MSVDFNWPELKAAREMGLSYGKYKALTFDPQKNNQRKSAGSKKRTPRKYTDQDAFRLWQEGKSDAEIARSLGVSRALIQRWRDTLELPSTTKHPIDTKKYRLQQAEDGTIFAIQDDNLTISAKPVENLDKK